MRKVFVIAPIGKTLLAYVKRNEKYVLSEIDADGNVINTPALDWPPSIKNKEEFNWLIDARSKSEKDVRILKITDEWYRFDSPNGSVFVGKPLTGRDPPFSGDYFVGYNNSFMRVKEGHSLAAANFLEEITLHGKARFLWEPGETIGTLNGMQVRLSVDAKEIRIDKYVFPALKGIITAASEGIERTENGVLLGGTEWCCFEHENNTICPVECSRFKEDDGKLVVDGRFTADDWTKLWYIMREVHHASFLRSAGEEPPFLYEYPDALERVEWIGDTIVVNYLSATIHLEKPEDLWLVAKYTRFLSTTFSLFRPLNGELKDNNLWFTVEYEGKKIHALARAVHGLHKAYMIYALSGKPFPLDSVPCKWLEFERGIVPNIALEKPILMFRCVETGKLIEV